MILAIAMTIQQHAVLERMAGQWTTVQRVVTSQSPLESRGSATGRMEYGGRFLFFEAFGVSQGRDVRVLTILGYDAFKKEYLAVALGENSTTIHSGAGGFVADTNELVLHGRMDDEFGNRPVRYVFRFLDQDRFDLQVFDTDEGKEFLVVETQHLRAEETRKHVTGIGGIFFKSDHPEKLRAWYATHLGIAPMNEHLFEGGTVAFEGTGYTVWGPFSKDTKYFEPSTKPYMLNYRVRDLDELLMKLRQEGVEVEGDVAEYPYGRFAWIMDPEGNRIELWEPAPRR